MKGRKGCRKKAEKQKQGEGQTEDAGDLAPSARR